MKKTVSFLLTICILSVFTYSCKSDKNSGEEDLKNKKNLVIEDDDLMLTGEFIHVDTAAVLKVKNKLYGVKMDDMAKSIIVKAEEIKTDDYDIINVVVKAEINPNPELEGWQEIVTIKSLDNIYKPETNQDTKVLNYSSNKKE